jgi:hypothetical protein
MGLEIPALRITDPKESNTCKKLILAVDRIHLSESDSLIVLWGMVKRLLMK